MVLLGIAADAPNWDPLWFLDGHPMRKELDKVMEEFVMKDSIVNGHLVERPYCDFQSMIDKFGNEHGERFWGKTNREHLGSGAPVWTENTRSIKMALRWVFREIEERLHQKMIAEVKQRKRAGGHQQAITGVENIRPSPSHARQESNLPDAPGNALNPTVTTLAQGIPNLKRERNLSFGDKDDSSNGTALLLAKFREITPGGLRRKPKRDARSALRDSAADFADKNKNGKGQVVAKKAKHQNIQDNSHKVKGGGVMKTNAPRLPLPSQFQQSDTTVHFFLSDPSFGAIPKSLQECMTQGCFFIEALTAWRGIEPDSSIPTMVSVRFDWASVPMVIKWKDKTGFRMMLEAIAAAPCWSQLGHHCNVEVRCVKQNV